jgi:hypothetical protein
MPNAARTLTKPDAKKLAAKVAATAALGNFYLGQVEAFAFNFAPTGWMACNGQTLAIQQNQALFSLLGTTYGGDGVRTFGLPRLAPVTSAGPNFFIATSQTMFPYPTRQ